MDVMHLGEKRLRIIIAPEGHSIKNPERLCHRITICCQARQVFEDIIVIRASLNTRRGLGIGISLIEAVIHIWHVGPAMSIEWNTHNQLLWLNTGLEIGVYRAINVFMRGRRVIWRAIKWGVEVRWTVRLPGTMIVISHQIDPVQVLTNLIELNFRVLSLTGGSCHTPPRVFDRLISPSIQVFAEIGP